MRLTYRYLRILGFEIQVLSRITSRPNFANTLVVRCDFELKIFFENVCKFKIIVLNLCTKSKVMTKIIVYKGYKILRTAGLFCALGLCFTSLAKAKKAIDSTVEQIGLGIY